MELSGQLYIRERIPGTQWAGDWEELGDNLDGMFMYPHLESNTGLQDSSLFTVLTELHYPN